MKKKIILNWYGAIQGKLRTGKRRGKKRKNFQERKKYGKDQIPCGCKVTGKINVPRGKEHTYFKGEGESQAIRCN